MDLLIERIFHLICKSRRVGYVCHFVADVSDGACLQGSICRWFGRRQDLRHLSVLSQLIPNEFYRYNRCVCTVMQHVDLTRIYDAELFGGGVPCPLGINKLIFMTLVFPVPRTQTIRCQRDYHLYWSAKFCREMSFYFSLSFLMAALWNRAGHYIFALWFLSFFFFFFFPHLISAVGEWMSTILPHMVWP